MRIGWLAALALMAVSVALAGCGREAPVPPSPGVALVANATASGLPTIAEFGAAACASCREMKIVLDSVARKTAGKAHVLVIDISKDYEAAQAFRIQLMPTQVFFDAKGKEIGRHMGKLTEAEIMARLGFSS
ncbi:thioredoxin family protein [Sulfuricystis multivorans]|uniref:thioredoxin family protein n=1 Tax=Sulfuricystis multivorans TaxID=2211108 RepID=UPI000F81D471|nr:thioredoxin family protein [Sulfuricystis multivorans]